MTQNFRKTLLATTMLAGLAIFTLDAAQAGPNGGPSLGNISGFSSMRMDFNRIGGPGRALSRGDLRIVPLDVVKTEKSKDTKNVAKKSQGKGQDTKVARVSNPKSVSGGKGKESVGSGPDLRIPGALTEIITAFGGNTEAIFGLKEMLALIESGPLVVGDPLSPNGNDPFARPSFGSGERWGGANSGEGGTNAPGGPDTSRTGWASREPKPSYFWNHGMRQSDSSGPDRNGNHVYREEGYDRRDPSARYWLEVEYTPNGTSITTFTRKNADGLTEQLHITRDSEGNVIGEEQESNQKEEGEKEKGSGNPKDSQPVEEGTGRGNSNDCGWWGCTSASSSGPSNPRIIPPETEGASMGSRQSTSWATDPNPDNTGGGGGGGGGRSGYDPRDEGCDNPGACGGPPR